jgi:uncharacterized protein
MKVNGTATLHAPVDAVWTALHDPGVLQRTIPGCDALEEVGPDAYAMTVTAGVASIKGSYRGDVRMTEPQHPHAFTLQASGAGGPGTVSAAVKVHLADAGDGTTTLTYDADAVVGGAVGGVGQRVLTGVAKKMAAEFFKAVDADLTGVTVAAVPATALPTQTLPVPTMSTAAPFDLRNQLPGVLVGAAVALAGVWLGWRIARR